MATLPRREHLPTQLIELSLPEFPLQCCYLKTWSTLALGQGHQVREYTKNNTCGPSDVLPVTGTEGRLPQTPLKLQDAQALPSESRQRHPEGTLLSDWPQKK